MPETKKVKELMIPLTDYPKVYDDDNLKEAIKTLKNYLANGKEHRSLMVFSRKKKVGNEEELVGILTVRDILNAMKRNRMCYENTELFTLSWAYFYHKDPVAECTVTKVGKAIRPLVKAYVQAEDTVTRAIELMMRSPERRLPLRSIRPLMAQPEGIRTLPS
ncbi:MAG: CBS domain-containing protein [Firmicutes bacterium]|nr:CBS domain-containing protein [Bacillota bacterium]